MYMKLIMKISFLVCALLLSNCFPAYAQHSKKRFRADFRMGLNYVTMSGTESATVSDAQGFSSGDASRIKLGMHIGTNLNYKVIGNFQVQTGFFVTKKGYKKYVWEERTETGLSRLDESWYEATANYIQVPLNIGYELSFLKDMAFNINGGLYVAYGYGNKGRIKYDALATTLESGQDPVYAVPDGTYEELTFSDTRWDRPDYGLNGSIGFIYSIYTINLGYEHGLHNVIRNKNRNMEHRLYSLSLGFRF
jgi:hypothetical protein